MPYPNFSSDVITPALVKKLIKDQFPQWAYLEIRAVENGGHDNRTFHLGNRMSVRLPSAECYAAQVLKEQTWLPRLAPHLSYEIPVPLALGVPSSDYPFHWSVYKWIDGKSAKAVPADQLEFPVIAAELAQFLQELHKVDAKGGPVPGEHNFWRGAHLAVYDSEARAAIEALSGLIDVNKALAFWNKALNSHWAQSPVWVHGDFAAGNILIKDGRLAAVIDFGCMAVGDPACDLVIAWTFLQGESREIFKNHMTLDEATWDRARGWALWKACIELVQIKDKKSAHGARHVKTILDVIADKEFFGD